MVTEFLEFLRKRLILIRELLSERGSIYLHIDYKIGHYALKLSWMKFLGLENFRNDIQELNVIQKFQKKCLW